MYAAEAESYFASFRPEEHIEPDFVNPVTVPTIIIFPDRPIFSATMTTDSMKIGHKKSC